MFQIQHTCKLTKKIELEQKLSKLYHRKSCKYNVRLQKMPKIHTFRTLTYKIFLSGIQNMGSQ